MSEPRCKGIAFEALDEAAPAVGHGLGARRAVVAVPAAEPRADPGKPGERALRPGVPLARGPSFEACPDRGDGLDRLLLDDVGRGALRAIARIDELDDLDAHRKPERRQIEEAARRRHLARLEVEAVGLQGVSKSKSCGEFNPKNTRTGYCSPLKSIAFFELD